MSEEQPKTEGPDLSQGVALATLADGAMLLGHVGDEPVLLARRAVSAALMMARLSASERK